MGRFSQAISEGDGISVVPLLEGDVAGLAAIAESGGAEAIAVWTPEEVEAAKRHGGLPVLVRRPSASADACSFVFRELVEDEEVERLYASLTAEGIDCVLEVNDDEELEQALELVDPEIILISERDSTGDEADLERTLDLLPDVPAGKLVISESRVNVREQVVALERAGVDAVLVGADALRAADLSAALAELTGR
jgi:indole-3-glycerol phosphate synthase